MKRSWKNLWFMKKTNKFYLKLWAKDKKEYTRQRILEKESVPPWQVSFALNSKIMVLKSLIFLALLASAYGDAVREIRVRTADCSECGMTFLGELSAKVA